MPEARREQIDPPRCREVPLPTKSPSLVRIALVAVASSATGSAWLIAPPEE